MSEEKSVRDYDRLILRLPDGMRERIAHRATVNRRSMNSEVISILGEALDQPDPFGIRALTEERILIRSEIDLATQRVEQLLRRKRAITQEIGARLDAANLPPLTDEEEE